MIPELCLLRGGGDLATGIAWRLSRAGWPVVVCELAVPLTVRRAVAVSSAVAGGWIDIEGMRAERVESAPAAVELASSGVVAVLVSPELPTITADVVVDARLAKRNIDTTIDDASLVVGVGPGFCAGLDCHAVVETQRGHHLGRVLWEGSAAPNTGTPGIVEGRGAERVLRAPVAGTVRWSVTIGDRVVAGQPLGTIDAALPDHGPPGAGVIAAPFDADAPDPALPDHGPPGAGVIAAPFDGVVRGLIAETVRLQAGLKIGDIDPRAEVSACHEISDKALAVGGGVVEAVLSWPRR